MTDKITRLPVRRRLHIINKPTIQQQINGIVTELEALPAHPKVEQVKPIVTMLEAICRRIIEEEA